MEASLSAEDAANWSYRGEGAANVVLEYTGSSPHFIGKVLRVMKDRKGGVGAASVLSAHEQRLWKDVVEIAGSASREIAGRMFAAHIMRPLLGNEHVDAGVHIVVSKDFLLSLEENIADQRPHWRVDAAKIDVLCDRALLISDHSIFRDDIPDAGICIAVEIKPKCGFLPLSEFITEAHAVKRHVSRFKMHQVLKLHQGEILQISGYDPLDLFSGFKSRIKQAIKALFATPQNNVRVFLNGSIVFGSLGGVDKGDFVNNPCQKNEIFEDFLKEVIRADNGLRLPSFQELIAEAAFKSGILIKLLEAQKLDTIDIEGAIHAYYNLISEPCSVCKNMNDPKLSLKYSFLHSLTLEESAKIVREYLIASTAKDCSLIISFRPTGVAENIRRRHSIFLESSGQTFDYKANFIDLDIKPLKKMIYYYELDKKIVELYSNILDVEHNDSTESTSL